MDGNHIKVKMGTVTINRTYTKATYDYYGALDNKGICVSLFYSGDPNWYSPGKIAVAVTDTPGDTVEIRYGEDKLSIPLRLVEPLRIALRLREQLTSVMALDKIKIHEEIK